MGVVDRERGMKPPEARLEAKTTYSMQTVVFRSRSARGEGGASKGDSLGGGKIIQQMEGRCQWECVLLLLSLTEDVYTEIPWVP